MKSIEPSTDDREIWRAECAAHIEVPNPRGAAWAWALPASISAARRASQNDDTETVSGEVARQLRLRAQGLAQPIDGAPPDAIAASLCGFQAQDIPGAELSLWARSTDLRPHHLDQAIIDCKVPPRSEPSRWACATLTHRHARLQAQAATRLTEPYWG
jgi:hypothetical protein